MIRFCSLARVQPVAPGMSSIWRSESRPFCLVRASLISCIIICAPGRSFAILMSALKSPRTKFLNLGLDLAPFSAIARRPDYFKPCSQQCAGRPASFAHLANSCASRSGRQRLAALAHDEGRDPDRGLASIAARRASVTRMSTSRQRWQRSILIRPSLTCCGPSRATSMRREVVSRGGFEHQPGRGAKRMSLAVLLDLLVGPRMVALRLRQRDLDDK